MEGSEAEPIPPFHQNTTKIYVKTSRKNFKKIAVNRTKKYYLIGKYYWLINKQKTALKWWRKSIQAGEALDARPDLSRTYFEVGKSFQSPENKYKQLNGITAQEYLDKANAPRGIIHRRLTGGASDFKSDVGC